MRSGEQGFSLIELMLALAIVAALAALALPELASAQAAWRASAQASEQSAIDRAAARLARERGLPDPQPADLQAAGYLQRGWQPVPTLEPTHAP